MSVPAVGSSIGARVHRDWSLCAITGLATIFALLVASAAGAATTRFVELYSATVTVESRSVGDRRKAAATALDTVFSRISGSPYASRDYPGLASSLRRADRLVSGYQYQERKAGEESTLLLEFSFDQAAVRRALQQAGAPRWSANRPVAEVWLVEQQGSSKRWVTASSNPGLYDALLREAERVGLPIRLPAEQGDRRLSTRSAWQLADSDIVRAASQGNSSIAMVGRVAAQGNGWRGQWKLYNHGELDSVRIDTGEPQKVAALALQPLASALAQRFSVRATSSGTEQSFEAIIDNLREPRDYLAMINELENIEGLNDLQLLEVSGETCRFRFSFSGTADRARSQLTLNSRLVHSGAGDALYFSWRR